jgi:hypothetical protein
MHQPLNPQQQRCVERLAREKGTACTKCGSTDFLSSGRMAIGYLGTSDVEVDLLCNNASAHPEGASQILTLSDSEARECGIRLGS